MESGALIPSLDLQQHARPPSGVAMSQGFLFHQRLGLMPTPLSSLSLSGPFSRR